MNNFFRKLELNVILDELSKYAVMPSTSEKLLKITPISDIEKLQKTLEETYEALTITERLERAPINICSDYINIIKIANKGGKLDGLELYETYRLYFTVRANMRHDTILEKEDIPHPYYHNLVEGFYINEELEETIKRSIDETGYVLDEASSTLRSIRQKLRQMDVRIKNKLQEILGKESSKLSQTTISIRNDRYVIPVKAEYKNTIKGTVQDVSASSQTFYIEPLVIMEMTNEKQTLMKEEVTELDRILHKLSVEVGNDYEILKSDFEIIEKIDFIFAKALMAHQQQATLVKINNQHIMKLVNARHPLLKVAKVIPNNISFDEYLGIVITGPNTGGKTVLLKTVGLLCIMTKCGLLVPADERSEIMIYDRICCDIGDDQSIQENLSTFSSHMKNISNIINTVTPNSLVLFDEIGGGTDPDEGSKLAMAILTYLINNQISFITTTHYSELKAFAYESEKVVNASMEFDQDTLSPTYKLIIGLPGSSNAFNIASRLGLKKEIVNDARSKSKTNNSDLRSLIEKLERRAHKLMDDEKELELMKTKNSLLQVEFEEKLSKLEQDRYIILEKANKDAERLLDEVTLKARNILEEIKELKNRDIKPHEMIALKKELDDLRPEPVVIQKVVAKDIRLGDSVYVRSYDQYGTIMKIMKNSSYEVSLGNVIMVLKKPQLEIVDKIPESSVPKVKIDKSRVISSAQISLTLDLRGERYEDAKERLQKYFDDITLTGIKQFSIIHGYGTGAIRGLVQDFLKHNKNVEMYRYGGAGEGGMGSTIVTLK